MFGIGMPEMLLILAIALIVIGPKKLPDLAKYLGRAIGEFKKAASDFKESIDVESNISEVKHQFDDINDNIRGATDVKSVLSSITDENQTQAADDNDRTGPADSPAADDADSETLKSDKGLTHGE